MQTTLRRASRLVGIAAVALIPVLGTMAPAQAATSVTYQLQASAAGQTGTFTISPSVSGTAPSSVAAGSNFSLSLTVGSITVPTSASGYTVNQISGITLKIPVPSNSTYDSSSLSGGTNYGSGTPSVSESGGVISISVPGPIKAGTTVTLPTLTLDLTAGAAGSTITSTLYGSSYSSPGITFTAQIVVIFFDVNASVVGYPTTSPALTTTTVS